MTSAGTPPRVRVTLLWIQITDNKEAVWDDEGEFRFRTRVTTAGRAHEVQIPEQGYWSISDHPRRNKVEKIDKVIFEGEAGDSLLIELSGLEMDQISPHDLLTPYRREFTGIATGWAGRHQPSDEGPRDPETLPDWRVAYDIEVV